MHVSPGEVQFNRGFVADSLSHTCTILRREYIGEDPNERPIWGDYEPHATDVSCYLWVQTGGERVQDGRLRVEYEYRLKLPAGTDITEDDLIDDVVNQLGEPQNSMQVRISAVWRRTHETICVLEKVV